MAHYTAIESMGNYTKTGLYLAYLYFLIDKDMDSIYILRNMLSIGEKDKLQDVHVALSRYYISMYHFKTARYHLSRSGCGSRDTHRCTEMRIYDSMYHGSYKHLLTMIMELERDKRYLDNLYNDDYIGYINYHILISSIMRDVGNYRKSATYLERVRDDVAKRLGERNVFYADILRNQAIQCFLDGNYDEVIEKCKRSKWIYLHNTDIENYGIYFCDIYAEAARAIKEHRSMDKQYIYEAIKYLKGIYERDVPEIANLLVLEASIENTRNNYSKAIMLLNRAERIYRNMDLDGHIAYGLIKRSMGVALINSGKVNRGIKCLAEAKDIIRKSLGVENEHYINTMFKLAWIYSYTHMYKKAEETILEIKNNNYYKMSDEKRKVELVEVRCQLSTTRGNLKNAEKLCEEALKRKMEYYSKDDSEVAKAIVRMAIVESKMGKDERAIGLFKKALDIYKNNMREYRQVIVEVLNMLSYVYERRGMPGKAVELEYEIRSIEKNVKLQ